MRRRLGPPTAPAGTEIIAEAAPLEGVLENLAQRVAGDGRFHAELAEYYDAHGQAPLADAARAKARLFFEEKVAKAPGTSAWATDLAQLLFDQYKSQNSARWTVTQTSPWRNPSWAPPYLYSLTTPSSPAVKIPIKIGTVSTLRSGPTSIWPPYAWTRSRTTRCPEPVPAAMPVAVRTTRTKAHSFRNPGG